jgi:hypothetical protein
MCLLRSSARSGSSALSRRRGKEAEAFVCYHRLFPSCLFVSCRVVRRRGSSCALDANDVGAPRALVVLSGAALEARGGKYSFPTFGAVLAREEHVARRSVLQRGGGPWAALEERRHGLHSVVAVGAVLAREEHVARRSVGQISGLSAALEERRHGLRGVVVVGALLAGGNRVAFRSVLRVAAVASVRGAQEKFAILDVVRCSEEEEGQWCSWRSAQSTARATYSPGLDHCRRG